MNVNLAIGSLQTDSSSGHTERAAYDLHAIENIHIQRTIELIRDQSFKVSIYNYFFAICQFLETRKGFIELNLIERMSHFSKPIPQRVAAGMFTKHEFGLINAHVLRAHDLIGRLMLEHAILMNASFVCKRI